MMGAAMLKHHQFVWSLWALYRLVVSSITFVRHLYVGESGAALVYSYKREAVMPQISAPNFALHVAVLKAHVMPTKFGRFGHA